MSNVLESVGVFLVALVVAVLESTQILKWRRNV